MTVSMNDWPLPTARIYLIRRPLFILYLYLICHRCFLHSSVCHCYTVCGARQVPSCKCPVLKESLTSCPTAVVLVFHVTNFVTFCLPVRYSVLPGDASTWWIVMAKHHDEPSLCIIMNHDASRWIITWWSILINGQNVASRWSTTIQHGDGASW